MTFSERTYQIVIGVLVLIILIGGWWMYAKPASTGSAVSTSSVASTQAFLDSVTSAVKTGGSVISTQSANNPTAAASGEALTVENQKAGTSVVVALVTLSQPGWVAVRDSNGKTLGAAWFDTGTHEKVLVPLLRSTEAGRSYQALLYIDDGDKQFDLHKDALVSQGDGSVVGKSFSVQ